MTEVLIKEKHLACALLTYGIPFRGIISNAKGMVYSFIDSVNTQNVITLYKKQENFLEVELEKQKYFLSKKIRGEKSVFGGLKEVYKESKQRIKGAPRKVNGTWKQ